MIATAMYLAIGKVVLTSTDLESFSVSEDSVPLSSVCEASTADQVRSCITSVRAGSANAIHINALITCSAVNECSFDLSNFPDGTSASSVSIYGDAGGTTGFRRTKYYDYSIFVNTNSKRISYSNLLFDDTTTEAAGPHSPIAMYQASDIDISNNKFIGAKFAAVIINNVSRVKILGNTFDSSQIFHIWGGDADQVHMRGNTFKNSYANAILAGFFNSKIVQNEFINNHHRAIWGVSGGQLDIVGDTRNLYVGCNNIHDSSIPGYPGAVGIEFAETDINNVELVGNRINNHDGYAVSINYGNSNVSNISIHNNSASNNGISPVTGTQYDYKDYTPSLFNNCTNGSCLIPCDYTIDSIFFDGF